MGRPRRPVRLWFKKSENQYIIMPGYIRTGCGKVDLEEAERQLREYIANSYTPRRCQSDPHELRIADILMVYAEAKDSAVARPKELISRLERLNEFWGGRFVSEVKGDTCRLYERHRGSASAARRELQDLSAAIRHYDREYGLDRVPVVTLPHKSLPRNRWLKRAEAAQLLKAARRTPHLARFILIGLYTGTRSGAIMSLQWHPNVTGGWIDLEKGVMHRKGIGERVSENKQRPPVKLNPKLLAHMKRWQRNDCGLRHVVHWNGGGVKSVKRAFKTTVKEAGLDDTVTPHVLRHTAATWLMQAGVPIWEASGFLGMNQQTLERNYGHHHPDFQKGAANAY